MHTRAVELNPVRLLVNGLAWAARTDPTPGN